jgi:tetratricopeptide (TPR) repeat protein
MMGPVESAHGVLGRVQWLTAIETALADASKRQSRLLLITGEPGIGKSALLRAAAELAAEHGMAVYRGQCTPEPGAPPLWLWAQVIRALHQDSAADNAIDPFISHFVEPRADREHADVGTDRRFQLFEAVAVSLEKAGATHPLLITLDDLQWADEGSVALLGFLSRRLVTVEIAIIAAYRDAEASPAVRRLAAHAEGLPLRGLEDDAVADLIAVIQGTRPEPTTAAAVGRAAAGNPLFVRELTRLALAQGGWTGSDGEFRLSVPDSVAQTLRERLAMLSPRAVAMLEAAAIAGRYASPELLSQILGQPGEQVREVAAEAITARVLRESSDRTSWMFVHDLYPAVLEADLSPLHRAVLNASIGEALEALGNLGPESVPAGRLAAHFVDAGDRFRPKAERYARLAAADATRRFGHIEACRYLELALQLLGDDHNSGAERLDLLLELGAARRRAGDLQNARDAYLQVARLANDGHPLALARAALGLTSLEVRSGTPVDENIGLLRRAITELEMLTAELVEGRASRSSARISATLSRLYAALARELVHSDPNTDQQDRPAVAAAAADRALQLAAEAADPIASANAMLARHDASWRPGTAAQRLPLIAELIKAAEVADDPDLVAEGILLRAAGMIELGDPEGIHQLRRFVELSERLGHARGQWAALSRRATLGVITGDLDRAAELTDAALELGTEIGVPDCLGCYGATSISFAILGRPIELEIPPEGDPIAFIFPIMKALSMPAADHRQAVQNVPLPIFEGRHDLELQVAAAAAVARFGTDDQRRAVYQTLAEHAGNHVVIGGCATYYGPVDHYLGLLAVALGDASSATEHFQAAVETARRLGASPWEQLAEEASAAISTPYPTASFKQEGPTWCVAYQGLEVHLPNAKGLHDLATMIAKPGHEIHVYTLLGRNTPPTGADPVLDEEAKRQYRRHAAQLQEIIEQADRDDDADASQAASLELEALTHELSAATGLRGRARRLDDEVERARKTVSARIHDALSRIALAHPALGSHFRSSIVLGVRCSYQPNEAIHWELRST